jgi:hypothetical protein
MDAMGDAYVTGLRGKSLFGPYDVFVAKIVDAPIAGMAALALTITGTPDPVRVGALLTYTISVTNRGPDAATNIQLTVVLGGVSGEAYLLVSVTPSRGSCVYSGVDSWVRCALQTLPYSAVADPSLAATQTAWMTSDTVDADLTENTATTTTMVIPASCHRAEGLTLSGTVKTALLGLGISEVTLGLETPEKPDRCGDTMVMDDAGRFGSKGLRKDVTPSRRPRLASALRRRSEPS